MNKNDYSKFKYQNGFDLKFSVNPYTKKTSVINTELKTIKPYLEDNVTGLNIGQTVVSNYVYANKQVNYVDQPLVNESSIKKIFFKLFKLS